MIRQINKRAQGLTEYALVIAAVAVALLTMQIYFKRGVHSMIKSPVDSLAFFGVTHEELMSNPKYAEFVNTMAAKYGFDPSNPSEEMKRQLPASYSQDAAIKQETDPLYGALKGSKIHISTSQSVTVQEPAESGGEKKMAINDWQEKVNDMEYIDENGRLIRGKLFYQEIEK